MYFVTSDLYITGIRIIRIERDKKLEKTIKIVMDSLSISVLFIFLIRMAVMKIIIMNTRLSMGMKLQ